MKNTQIIFSLIMLTLLFACSKQDAADINQSNGVSGSMARFILVDHYLYVVDNTTLATYDVSNDAAPVLKDKQDVGFGIETLFPYESYLLIGSNSGMFIYETNIDGVPSYISEYDHIETCDPVVTNGSYAYVTLRSSRLCGGNVAENNRLEIIDIQNVNAPSLVQVVSMNNPKGLALDNDNNLLFICVADEGVNVYDISAPTNPVLINSIPGFIANDVIAQDNTLLVVCSDGLRQFDYANPSNITNLSYFSVNF